MAPDPAAGTEVAGFRIVEQVGSGGMGVVYRAEEVGLGGRPVALKLLPPALAGDPDFRARFLREMRVAAAIDHPNIVPIYRAGEDRGLLYLAMRYVNASDLRRVLEVEGRLEPGRALAILDQVARALDAAHASGLVHRDVKPGNILLAPPVLDGETEHVYLVDFGLARADGDDRSIGGGGWFLGTPRYAAPEQAAGDPVDGRTDGYALGCVLYECLTGRPPFPGGSSEAVLLAHLEAAPPRVSAARPELPPALDQVVLRALAKAKQDRFPSCRALVAAARHALAPTPTRRLANPAPPSAPAPSWGPPAGARHGYLPLRRPARRLRVALWVSILLALASASANLGDTRAARLLLGDDPSSGTLYLWVGLVQAMWFLVTAGLWLAWFRRAYLNLPALGARRLRYRPWWAVGAWLLPVFSLFRPKQVLNDIWRASDPTLPADLSDTWRARPVAELLGWWWLAFLASILVRSITTEAVHAAADLMLLGLLPEQLDRFQPSAGMQVLADLLTVLTGLLALRVVRRTTARQDDRAARVAGTGMPARR
jgi:serine/threonine-protein kinase